MRLLNFIVKSFTSVDGGLQHTHTIMLLSSLVVAFLSFRNIVSRSSSITSKSRLSSVNGKQKVKEKEVQEKRKKRRHEEMGRKKERKGKKEKGGRAGGW